MTYFKIKKSLDPKIVGTPHNHSEQMSSGYDYDAPNSVYHWWKNNLVPNLKSVIINKNAKITDLINCIPVSGSGAILSERFLELLSLFNIMDYSLADVELVQSNKIIPGFLFFYFNCSIQDDDVKFSESKYLNIEFDYEKSKFNELEEFQISSFAELDAERPISQLRPVIKKLTLREDFKYDVFCLNTRGRLIVTEAVKNACIEQGIKGIRFEPFPELVRE